MCPRANITPHVDGLETHDVSLEAVSGTSDLSHQPKTPPAKHMHKFSLFNPTRLAHQWPLVRKVVHGLAMSLSCALGVLLPWGSVSAVDSDPRNFDLPGTVRPVEVRVSFHLIDVQGIDDEAETFEFSGIMTLSWRDDRQAFDPTAAGVSEKLYHGSYQVNELSPSWYPQVILANASQIPEAQGVLLRVAPDGACTLIQDVHAVGRKELQLRRYPFDQQNLEAVFQILGLDRSQVVLAGDSNAVTADIASIRVPEWYLQSVSGDFREISAPYHPGTEKAATFVISLHVHRKAFFAVWLIIVPLLIVVGLSWCVFWMDRTSLADRMSVTFVGLLTAVAYQSMLGDFMPNIAYVTFANAFINFSLLLMSATAVVNLSVCLCDRNGNQTLGDRIDQRCRWLFPTAYAVLILLALVVTFYFL